MSQTFSFQHSVKTECLKIALSKHQCKLERKVTLANMKLTVIILFVFFSDQQYFSDITVDLFLLRKLCFMNCVSIFFFPAWLIWLFIFVSSTFLPLKQECGGESLKTSSMQHNRTAPSHTLLLNERMTASYIHLTSGSGGPLEPIPAVLKQKAGYTGQWIYLFRVNSLKGRTEGWKWEAQVRMRIIGQMFRKPLPIGVYVVEAKHDMDLGG